MVGCVKDDIIYNYTKIFSRSIVLPVYIPDDNIYINLYSNKILFLNIDDVVCNGVFNRNYTTSAKHIIDSYINYGDMIYPYLTWKTQEELNSKVELRQHAFHHNSTYFLKLEKIDINYVLHYYCKNTVIDNCITPKKTQQRSLQQLEILVSNLLKSESNMNNSNELNHILNNVPTPINDTSNYNLLKDSVKLYNYQKNDITWMNNLKNQIIIKQNDIKISYNPTRQLCFVQQLHPSHPDYSKNTFKNIYFVLYQNTLIHCEKDEHSGNTMTSHIKFNGGNIISEMGVGKTLVCLGYIFNNLYKNNFDKFIKYDNTTCNYFYKRGKNKGVVCLKKKVTDLYCKAHSTTLFIDKRKTKLNLTDFNIRDYVDNFKFKTNASLIICPNHLCDQWVREYYEKFNQNNECAKRVILIATSDQYTNITLAEMLFADLIIVSYNFLVNANYAKKSCSSVSQALDKFDIYTEDVDPTVKNMTNIDLIIKNMQQNIMNKHQPELCLLHNFNFVNIFLDEFHELNDKPLKLQETVSTFTSQFRWNISGTPFPKQIDSFIFGMTKISNLNLNNIQYNYDYLNKDSIKALSVLYRRNTKESIKNEYTDTILTENIQLLEFTEQERVIYDGYVAGNTKFKNNYDYLIKLCCDTSIDKETKNLVKNCKTLDEIQTVILKHNLKKVVDSQKEIKKLEQLIKTLVNTLEHTHDEDTCDTLKMSIGNNRRSLTIEKKTFDSVNRTYLFLKKAVDDIKVSEVCPICLDDILENDIAMTKCGHKFCQECIKEYIEELKHENSKCPKCNIPIHIDDIFLLKDIIIEKIVQDDPDPNSLVNLIKKIKSTKIGNIVYYLKNNIEKTDKCILFSQWDEMLNKIGGILESEQITVKYCTGTVYQRTRAIENFTNDPNSNVIFLSSENAASGINLTAANKIIFIEPIYGTYQYRKDTENQSIGRAARIGQKKPIEIIRFIVKNTVEETIIHENKIENEAHAKQTSELHSVMEIDELDEEVVVV